MITELNYGEDPQGRKRFYGIYSATVVAINDPLSRNRIKVQVHMPTGSETTNWAKPCLPITSNSYHPDHQPHTAAQIASLLTTSPTSVSGGTGGGSVPALTIVPIGSGKLTHAHTPTHSKVGPVNSSTDPRTNLIEVSSPVAGVEPDTDVYTSSSGITAPNGSAVPEHTFHRNIPAIKQLVWVMFEAGDPEYPVWVGVQS